MSKKILNYKVFIPYLWLLPSFILFGIFTFFPFIRTIYKSFYIVNSNGNPISFVGLDNYLYILKDEKFLLSVRNSVIFTIFTVPTSKILGFILAFIANKKRKFSIIYETSFALPMAISTSVVAMIFQLIFVSPLGILNGYTGVDIGWLTDSRYALFAIGIVQIWMSTGYAFVFLLAAIRSVPLDLIESSSLDGASTLKQIFHIYIPFITPTLFYLIFTDLVYGMMMMGLANVLTDGGPNNSTLTIMQYIYKQFASAGNYTNANAASVIIFIIVLTCTLLTFLWEKKGVHYQ